jgi:hypothetical protein
MGVLRRLVASFTDTTVESYQATLKMIQQKWEITLKNPRVDIHGADIIYCKYRNLQAISASNLSRITIQ